jgi:hypothetical protein
MSKQAERLLEDILLIIAPVSIKHIEGNKSVSINMCKEEKAVALIDDILFKERQQCAERYCNIKCVLGLQCRVISPGHYCSEYNAIIDKEQIDDEEILSKLL